MATSRPRITVTLTPPVHKLLRSMAQARGVSQSALVLELLELAAPALERAERIIRAGLDAPKEALESLRASIEIAEGEALANMAESMELLDSMARAAEGVGAGVAGTAPSVSPSGVVENPRLVTRGSGF